MTNALLRALTICAIAITFMSSLMCQAQPTGTMTVAIQTSGRNYLTAVAGGGLGGPDSGPTAVALHTDATSAGPWETFTFVWLGEGGESYGPFALRTANGNYVTAVGGGGIGGPNDGTAPIHTDATTIGAWETLQMNFLPNNQVTIQTPDGRFLTAVNGGGMGGPNTTPIHTDATSQGVWEVFSLINVGGNSGPVTSPTVSSIQGPTIYQERCGVFSTAFMQWFTTYTTPEPTGYGIQMCTWISWPSNPIVVPSGSLNVTIPVLYMGDQGEPASSMWGGGFPSTYPLGQSHANFIVTVTANDVTAYGVVSGTAIPNPGNSDCNQSTLIAAPASTATFTGSIAGNTMTVASIANGSLVLFSTVSGPGVAAGTLITGFGTGTGLAGTYTVSVPQTVASETMTTGASNLPVQTQNSGSMTLYDFKAPDAPAGASATGQQATFALSYGQIVIPIDVTWAQSILTFTINVSQGVPGPLTCNNAPVSSDPENMCYEVPQCNTEICKTWPYWVNQGTFNTANSPPSPAFSTIACGGQCLCQQPQSSEVDVIPFAAFQLGYLPLAVIYSPIGSKAQAQYTLSDISGTQFQFGGSIATANSSTVDDKEALTGTVKLGSSGTVTGTWDQSIQNTEGNQYGQVATITNTSEIDKTIPNFEPPGWPATNQMDYYHEPFHNDIIVVAPHPQFLTWDYPDGYFAMPIGSAPSFEATVDQLAACASPGNALRTTTFKSAGPAASAVSYSLSTTDCAALLAADPFAAQDTQDAILPSFLPIDSGSVNAYTGVSWTEKSSTSTNIQTSAASTYSTNVTAVTSFAAGDTVDPLAAFENVLTISFGLTNTTTTTTQTTISGGLTSASANTLQNGVSATNGISDPSVPPTFPIDYRAMQDAYFGTIAIQDQDAGNLPHCLLESFGVVTLNPPPGCNGVHLPTGLPSCVQDGTCITRSAGLNLTYSTAQANVFKRRHFVRPLRRPTALARAEVSTQAQMFKYLTGARLPSDKMTAIQKALNPQSLVPPPH